MPVNTSYSNFYIYKDFSGPVDRISLGLIDNNTSLDINGIPNQYNLTVGQWNLIEILINENNTATVKVNGVEVGSYSVSSITPEGVQIGTFGVRSATPRYVSGEGFWDDLNIYVEPIVAQQVQPVSVENLLLTGVMIATVVAAILSILLGRIYYEGKKIRGMRV